MKDDFATTVAFTGHRTYCNDADAALRATVGELYARGFRTFLCGMAVGFDLAAAEAVLSCRDAAGDRSGRMPAAAETVFPAAAPTDAPMPDLRLVAVVPFQGQESRFSTADRAIFHRVLAAADRVIVLAPAYRPGCYAVRNNYLIDHASLLVAWYDGSPGGTHYTVRRALARRLEFINLHRAAPSVPRPEPTLF